MKMYIGFSKPNTFKIGAEAISYWCGTPYSHVYIRFEYNNSKDAIFHAAHGMVHFKSDSNFLKVNNVIKEYEFEISSDFHDEMFDQCMDLSGEGYGYSELLKILISDIIYNVFKKEVDFSNGIGYICSELAGKLLQDKLNIHFVKPLHLLKPLDIDKELELRPELCKLVQLM